MEKSTTTVTSFGQKTAESVENYNKKGDLTSEVIKAWSNDGDSLGEATETYENGNVTRIDFEDKELDLTAIISCDNTGCIVANVTTPDYVLTYDSTTSSYNLLLTGETNNRAFPSMYIDEFNYGSVIEDIDEDVQAIIDSLS